MASPARNWGKKRTVCGINKVKIAPVSHSKRSVKGGKMKRYSLRVLAFVALGCMFAALCAAQESLGDKAREIRKKKPAEPTTKVVTNEDITTAATTRPPDTTANTATDKSSSVTADKSTADGEKPKPAVENQTDIDKEWQEKIAAQKEAIALLERELNVLQRENRLRAASYYGDAGSRLRNERQYADDDRKYRDQVTTKQKAIDDAKAKLEQMKDEARKAGASPGAIG